MTRPFLLAVSAGALFDGTDGDGEPQPGLCFDIVKRMASWSEHGGPGVQVCVVSRRSPLEGGRLLRAIAKHGLRTVTGCFVGDDGDVVPYVVGLGADIFLSRNMNDVQAAVDAGIPSARMHGTGVLHEGEELRIAFDGDAVLFDCSTERLFQAHGLDTFFTHENDNAEVSMLPGPLMPFFQALVTMQGTVGHRLFRSALVTARNGVSSERAVNTLQAHGVSVDVAAFCGEMPKLGALRAFQPHVFFDDSDKHLEPAAAEMPTGKVPWKTLA